MRTGELYQRYYGLYLATVEDVDDPEGLGRVRVSADQFEDAEDDVVWVTVARPAAGDGTGVFFTPKQGDQVVLGYVMGDVHEPIILGYAHSLKRPAPEQVEPEKHAIVTSIGSVEFDEVDKRITVTFKGSETSTLTMSDDGIELKGPAVRIEADEVCVNGQGVMLRDFALTLFNTHTHTSAGVTPPYAEPADPAYKQITKCGGT